MTKQKNVIEIENGVIFKQDKPYLLSSLTRIMRRDYLNKDKDHCDVPEKLLIQVSYDDDFNSLKSVLDAITDSYDEINPTVDFKTWLTNRVVEVIPLSAFE